MLNTAPASPPVARVEITALAILMAAFLGCLISLAWNTGVTVDEPAHLLTARMYWEGRDTLKPGDMPPLLKIVCGWAPLLMRAPLPVSSHPVWNGGHEWNVAIVMMERMNAAEIRKYFFAARLTLLIFPLGCALLMWWWGRQIFSPRAAMAATAVFCLSPTVLGHAPLVKNDLAASFGYLLFWYCAWRYWKRPLPRNAAWMGIGVLAGILSKFSLLILVPIAPLILVSRCVGKDARSARNLALSFVLLTAVVYAGVAAAWQFRFDPVPPEDLKAWETDRGVPAWLPALIHDFTLPVPLAFWRGGVSLVSTNGSATPYLLGQTVPGGHPLYFLVALAVKVPVATQILLLVSLGCVIFAILRLRLHAEDWCWVLPGFLYLGLASLSSLQLGVRLILPSLVFFFLLSGLVFDLALTRTSLHRAAQVLMAAMAFSAVRAYPHYISYFNSWVGDPRHGLHYLSDSNIDWGQDLRALVRWRSDHQIEKLRLSYFGTDRVWAYFTTQQIELVHPPWSPQHANGRTRLEPLPGYYAISATLLSGQFFAPEYRDFYAGFRNREPVARAGHSIYIYKIE